MKYIELTQGKRTQVDDDLYEWLNQWKWYYRKRHAARTGGDAIRSLHGKDKSGHNFTQTLYMAVLICPVPKGYVVDHQDRNPMNNQRYNLKRATYSKNTINSGVRINNKLHEKHIHWDEAKERYVVQLRIGKGTRIWKQFRDLAIAIEFRNEIVTKYHKGIMGGQNEQRD